MHPDLEDPPRDAGTFLPGLRHVRDLSLAMTVFSKGLNAALREENDVAASNRRARRRRSRDMTDVFGDPMEVGYQEEDEAERLAWAQRHATFAREQMAAGSPYLFGLAAIRLWGLLEATVDDGVARLIEVNQKVRTAPALAKVNVPFLEFSSVGPFEQAQLVTRALKDSVGASKKNGIHRFEGLLGAIGLGGPYEKEVENVTMELSGFRHVLVHRDGRVDERLQSQCPWLRLDKGTQVAVSRRTFQRFSTAAEWLLLEFERRLDVFDGRAKSSQQLQTQLILAGTLKGRINLGKKWPPDRET